MAGVVAIGRKRVDSLLLNREELDALLAWLGDDDDLWLRRLLALPASDAVAAAAKDWRDDHRGEEDKDVLVPASDELLRIAVDRLREQEPLG